MTDDLVVGVQFENIVSSSQTVKDAGAVHVIYGSTAGLTAAADQLRTQNNLTGDGPQEGDRFGEAVY